eukprot:2581314-Alexandrium_andersonii.AAC.1
MLGRPRLAISLACPPELPPLLPGVGRLGPGWVAPPLPLTLAGRVHREGLLAAVRLTPAAP